MTLTLGSLFDGSGGFPLAARNVGIKPLWASEVEPFPILVTTKNLPQVLHLGDINHIDGAGIEPVDVVTFGSPCQDLSIAGRQVGLAGERSSLFFQAVRIIKEMRTATNTVFPRFAIWENVPGALSSNKGGDFHVVLKTLTSIVDEKAANDLPRPRKWPLAGALHGDGWSFAWRVLDAQYFGVPQRRKRIFLTCDFAGNRAPQVLFEPQSGSGNHEPSSQEEQDHANPVVSSANASSRQCYGLNSIHQTDSGGTFGYEAAVSKTLDIKGGVPTCNQGGMIILEPVFSASKSDFFTRATTNQAGALLASDYTDPPIIGGQHLRPRRLTPLECGRLQGFPDQWCQNLAIPEPSTEELEYWVGVWESWNRLRGVKPRTAHQVAKWLAAPATDTALYKLWGNGVALPVVEYTLGRIATITGSETVRSAVCS